MESTPTTSPSPTSTTPLVTLHVWGVRPAAVGGALAAMALDRRRLHRVPGLRFAKLLGTGSGRTFGLRDADLTHWALLAAWDGPDAARAFERGSLHAGWARRSTEVLHLDLRPLASRGRWAGLEPFGDPEPVRGHQGPVAALTRARLRPRTLARFWRSVPPVSADLHRSPGLRLALGIGEAPVGLQGTFSVWDSAADLTAFAHRGAAHQQAVRRTAELQWYSEELFARFEVLDAGGTHAGTSP
ncbi:hypothetical protein CLV35_2595 [Motilibacter peucedani]|uniref:Spheroidene monooxygenase n=1 Tax=Motilibacter peucedani TaxID=598650 RepID=A0A420XPI8_9ACTN|nr:monooxygenase [Motilibacter peucedani]RKS74095.1 hypothetical protein CLV35_2595 [Motilibacter peucedani]